MKIKKVSIVAPMYNEEKNVHLLVDEIKQAIDPLKYTFEVFLVNDGSSDNTWNEISSVCESDSRFNGIDLAGNYGQTTGLRAGFEASSGDTLIFMDGDLQHNPADIPRFLEKLEEGYDMVGGAKAQRPDGWFQRTASKFAHSVISRISGVKMTYFGATYKAYRSYLFENINLMGDTHRFLGALIARKGVKHTEIKIKIRERKNGSSHYSLKKVFLVIIDLLFLRFTVSYMNKPFRLFGVSGGLLFLGGFFPILLLIIKSLIFNLNIRETYLTEFFFGIFLMIAGLLLVSFGLIAEIGIYNYFSSKGKKPYNIRQIKKKDKNEAADHKRRRLRMG